MKKKLDVTKRWIILYDINNIVCYTIEKLKKDVMAQQCYGCKRTLENAEYEIKRIRVICEEKCECANNMA